MKYLVFKMHTLALFFLTESIHLQENSFVGWLGVGGGFVSPEKSKKTTRAIFYILDNMK